MDRRPGGTRRKVLRGGTPAHFRERSPPWAGGRSGTKAAHTSRRIGTTNPQLSVNTSSV